ncbi:MAG: hypothetical protein AB7N54_14585 [Alphaproteobacteria bacterium]
MPSLTKLASTPFAIAAAAVLLATPAMAQETVKITVVSGYPPVATHVGGVTEYYIKEVDAILAKTGKYKVEWNVAHSGQIAKARGEIEAVQSGIADISPLPTPAHFDRVPLYQIPYVTPFTSDDNEVLVSVIEGLEKKFPQYDAAWRALNQRSISLTTNVDNYMVLSKKEVTKLADLKGMKIGAAGANLPYVTSVGATGVSALLTDWYPGLNSGLYEAVLGWPQAIASFKLCEPAKFLLNGHVGASSPLNLTVNVDWLARLPEEVRNAVLAAAPSWHKGQTALLKAGAQAGIELCTKQFGMKLTVMAEADTVAWAKSLPPLALDWAKAQDAKGLPGTGVLNAYMDGMRAAKQRVVRNWDKQ